MPVTGRRRRRNVQAIRVRRDGDATTNSRRPSRPDHYDKQSDDDAVAEDEAAYRSTLVTMMAIPVELVPKVQKLLAKRTG